MGTAPHTSRPSRSAWAPYAQQQQQHTLAAATLAAATLAFMFLDDTHHGEKAVGAPFRDRPFKHVLRTRRIAAAAALWLLGGGDERDALIRSVNKMWLDPCGFAPRPPTPCVRVDGQRILTQRESRAEHA